MNRRLVLQFTLALALTILADLVSVPQEISVPFSAGTWLALMMHYPVWLLGILGFGQFIQKQLQFSEPNNGLALGLGSFFYAMVTFLMGACGLLKPELRWLLFALNAFGVSIAGFSFRRGGNWKPLELALHLPVALLFLLPALDSLVVHPYWDALHHHLVGPRLWWEHGRIYFPTHSIAAYQEGGFELLFLWPHFYFAKAGGLGLLPVQLFAQLTHSILAFGGSILIAHHLIRRQGAHPAISALAILLFAAPLSLQFAIPTAKNDWGLVLWVLSGFLLLTESPSNRSRITAGAFLLGFSLLAKFSAVFFLLPVLILSLAYFPALREPRSLLLLATGFLAGMLPLAARNFLGTGNPFFPLFHEHFPAAADSLGPTWIQALNAYRSGREGWLGRLEEWKQEFFLSPILLLLPLLFFRTEMPRIRILAGTMGAGFVLFVVTTGAPAELRLVGACLPVSGLLAAHIAGKLLRKVPAPQALPYCLFILALPFIPFRWDTLARLGRISHPELQARSYVSAEAQAWFRAHYVSGMKAALLVDTRTYHSIPYEIVRIWDAPSLDRQARSARTPEELFSVLRASGFTHLILSQEKLDLFYPAELVAMVEEKVLAHEKGIVFRTPYSIVVDLRAL